MKKLLGILVLLLAFGLIAACGDTDTGDDGATDPDSEEENGATDPNDEFEDSTGEEIETDLQFSLQGVSEANPTLVYTVENTGDQEETLSFTTGQRYEYEIMQDGEVINRFSDDKAFTQALEDIAVAPGEEVTFDVELPSLDPGEYTINIFLVAADYGPASEVEETFEIK